MAPSRFGSGELAVELMNETRIRDRVFQQPLALRGRFRWSQAIVDEEIHNGSLFTASRTFRINVRRWNQSEKFKALSSLLSPEDGVGTNEDATDEMRRLFPETERLPFDYAKPTSLLETLVARPASRILRRSSSTASRGAVRPDTLCFRSIRQTAGIGSSFSWNAKLKSAER